MLNVLCAALMRKKKKIMKIFLSMYTDGIWGLGFFLELFLWEPPDDLSLIAWQASSTLPQTLLANGFLMLVYWSKERAAVRTHIHFKQFFAKFSDFEMPDSTNWSKNLSLFSAFQACLKPKGKYYRGGKNVREKDCNDTVKTIEMEVKIPVQYLWNLPVKMHEDQLCNSR